MVGYLQIVKKLAKKKRSALRHIIIYFLVELFKTTKQTMDYGQA